ncbi:diguanylate cyclase domain-containing protein, partial [Klebsiella pneumoniae]
SDILARQGGDEFIILFANTSRHDAAAAMETLSHNVARFNQQAANPWQLAFSWGCVEYDPASHPSLNALVATADRLMYQAKRIRPSARVMATAYSSRYQGEET